LRLDLFFTVISIFDAETGDQLQCFHALHKDNIVVCDVNRDRMCFFDDYA
jgi:hypothetical protein